MREGAGPLSFLASRPNIRFGDDVYVGWLESLYVCMAPINWLDPLEAAGDPSTRYQPGDPLANVETEIPKMFGRMPRLGDAISAATAASIRQAGFEVVYAPTGRNKDHVRIIARERDFDVAGREALASKFAVRDTYQQK